MSVDDGECVAGRRAHLHWRQNFLIILGWGAALGGETARCIWVGAWNALGCVRVRGTGWDGHEGLDIPGVSVSITYCIPGGSLS